MKAPFRDFGRLGIVQFMAYPECLHGGGPQVETVASLLRDPDFEVVEIGPISDPCARREVARRLRDAGVEAVFDGQPIVLFGGLDPEAEDCAKRQAVVEAMKCGVDEAHAAGSRSCGVMSGKAWPPGLDLERATDRLVDTLQQVCSHAEPLGVTICLEYFDSLPYSKYCLIGSSSQAARLADRVRERTPNFGLIPDLSHAPILDEAPAEMVRACAGRITRVQIGNASSDPYSPFYGDGHPPFGAKRTQVDVPELAAFLGALLDVGHLSEEERGIVSFEIRPPPDADPGEVIADSKRVLNEAWRRL